MVFSMVVLKAGKMVSKKAEQMAEKKGALKAALTV